MPIIEPSPICVCSLTITFENMVTFLSTWVEPQSIVSPVIHTFEARCELWAIKVSPFNLQPSSMIVSSNRPRAIWQFAPISTLLPTRTPAWCGNLIRVPSASRSQPRPSVPNTAPAWIKQFSPIVTSSYKTTLARRIECAPTLHFLPITHPASI